MAKEYTTNDIVNLILERKVVKKLVEIVTYKVNSDVKKDFKIEKM